MEYDIIKRNGKCEVYPRTAYNGDAYEENAYEGDPAFSAEGEAECMDWCDERKAEYRVREFSATVPDKFLRDLEKKLDGWRANLERCAKNCGYRLESDITYRVSAAWKYHPTHYCYVGDMGGIARLVREDKSKDNANELTGARNYLHLLVGAADSVWELGFTVTYDNEGKHTVYGACPKWITKDSAEL